MTRVLCCIGLVILSGCLKNFDPVSPSWDVTLNVPVTDHRYSLQEIVDNNPSILSTGPNGVLLYTTTMDFQPTSVADALKVDGTTAQFRSTVGTFSIDNAAVPPVAVTLGEMAPALVPFNGQTQRIPRTPFSLSDAPLPAITEFREAMIENGTFVVGLTNNLPTDLDNVVIVFTDTFGQIATVAFPDPIPSNGSSSQSVPLTHQHLSNQISFQPRGVLLASNGQATINIADAIILDVRVVNSTVSYADARIPGTEFTTQQSFLIDSLSTITQADIQSGTADVDAAIPFSASGSATVTVPELTLNGVTFTRTIPIVKGQSAIHQTYNLAGYHAAVPQNRLTALVDTRIDDSGNDYVILDASEQVNGTVTLSKVILSSVTGRIKPTSISVDRSVSINAADINKLTTGTIRFANAGLVVALASPSQGFDFNISGSIIGKNTATGKTATLLIPPDQQVVKAGIDSIVFQGSDVANFLNSLTPRVPDDLTLTAVATVNPSGTQQGTLRSSDVISGKVLLSLPINLSISGGVFLDTLDISKEDNGGEENISKSDTRDVQSARLTVEIENALPVSLGLDSLIFCDTAYRPLLVIPKPGQPRIQIQSGTVSGGVATQPVMSTTSIDLNHADADQIDAAHYVMVRMHLDTPTTQTVSFRTTDWVHIKATTTVNYRVNGSK